MFVYVCFMFVWQLVLWIDLTEGLYISKKSFEMCIYLWFEFDCPEVTQLLLLLLPSLCFSHSWRSEREDTHALVAILWAATSSPTILSLEYRMWVHDRRSSCQPQLYFTYHISSLKYWMSKVQVSVTSLLIDWLMIAYIALFSALLSRLTVLACGATWVTSFL